jgi:hypothetical protein
MYEQHRLKMAHVKYPGGLRIIECGECAYAFAVEVDQDDVLQMHTRIKINEGDFEASHSYFQIPEIRPVLQIASEIER